MSHPSRRNIKSQKKVDSDLQPYYDSITKKDVISSQVNPHLSGLSRNNGTNLVTNTTYFSILCKELQNQGSTKDKPYIHSRFDILTLSGFGTPNSPDHSFTSEVCFEHTFIHILKNDCLSPQNPKTGLHYHPLFKHQIQIITWSKTVDFSSLKIRIANFNE